MKLEYRFFMSKWFFSMGYTDGVLRIPYKVRIPPFSKAEKRMKGIMQEMLHRNKGNRNGSGIKILLRHKDR